MVHRYPRRKSNTNSSWKDVKYVEIREPKGNLYWVRHNGTEFMSHSFRELEFDNIFRENTGWLSEAVRGFLWVLHSWKTKD